MTLEVFIKETWVQVKELSDEVVDELKEELILLAVNARKNNVEYIGNEHVVIRSLLSKRLNEYFYAYYTIIKYASRCDEDKVRKLINSYLYCKRHNF